MNKIAVIFIFICMLVHASAQENDLLNKEMRSTINQIVATTEIPGISVAIAGKDGLIW